MRTKTIWISVIGTAILLLAAGLAGAFPANSAAQITAADEQPEQISYAVPQATVAHSISYQGHLTTPEGGLLDGNYMMHFVLYDAAVGGSAVWDSGDMNVAVTAGLFNVVLAVDAGSFDGQALWLSIIVEGETLSPRQEILPAPYALSLRPGADIIGEPLDGMDSVLDVEMSGFWPTGKTIAGYAPATGTAIYAQSNGGSAASAHSENTYGVLGSSTNGWGGYFTSDEGHGLRVNTEGDDIYDFGVYVTSEWGYAVYAQSTENMGVRGEAGDVTGLNQPLGPVGVVGIGTSRGVYGSSGNGSGVYGSSDSNYGMWGQSETYRGVTGRTDRPDNNYGLYTPDNMFALGYDSLGPMMQVVQNGGNEPLEPGDVVVFSGISAPLESGGPPVVQVAKATSANSQAVAGVVHSRFNIEAIDPSLESPEDISRLGDMAVTLEGPVPADDYLLMVIQGPAQVKANAVGQAIEPGDLLTSGEQAGSAAKAAMIEMGGVETAVPGTVIGKALESLAGEQGLIYIFVTLQ